MRNSADAETIAVGWWPGDVRYPPAAFAAVSPAAAHFDPGLGGFVLDWDDVQATPNLRADALRFARSVFGHASAFGCWDPTLTGSMQGVPPLQPRRASVDRPPVHP